MSGKGNCFDNAVTETFFHTLKTELMFDYVFDTREEAKSAIFEYIEIFYNRERRHSTLGYCSPVKFEQYWELQNVALRILIMSIDDYYHVDRHLLPISSFKIYDTI